MMKANQDIRDYMADHGVSQKMLAEQMHTYATYINTMLKKELSAKDKEIVLNHIDACAKYPIPEDQAEEACKDDLGGESVAENTNPFQIGDRVKIPSKGNKIGTISDIWQSLAKASTMYAVEDEEGHCGLYAEAQLELAPDPIDYHFEAHIDGNVAVVTMHATQGEKTWIYSRGHAHILHDGEVGMAQAVSYAAKRMFEALDKQQENKIYVKT